MVLKTEAVFTRPLLFVTTPFIFHLVKFTPPIIGDISIKKEATIMLALAILFVTCVVIIDTFDLGVKKEA